MNKRHTEHKVKAGKQIYIISLGSMILGILSISWALIHIQAQTVPVAYNENTDLIPIQADQRHSVKSSIAVPVEAGDSSSIPPQDDILYPIRPLEGDVIGKLIIPALQQILPIIHGTDEDELEEGIGHFSESVLPGENNNSVLSGHRDTVFAKLGELEIGNELVVDTSAGSFTYKISAIRIVDKDDKTIIVPTDHAVLTVSTCYPFHFIGAAPDRYILIADLIAEVRSPTT
ncbi:class D sortase [Paenibacillus sp. FSL R7-0297]|uniref:class D sortase n=1 Tax=Paenibacillus sp. FSL R7-0297 TaxID=2921680 RepID=UPI0030FB7211